MTSGQLLAPTSARSLERRNQQQLRQRIRKRSARIGIIGIGYVGLPLGTAFAQAGFQVTGFDVDLKRVTSLNKGQSYIADVPAATLKRLVKKEQKLKARSTFSELAEQDVVIICVPTPLAKSKAPDISFVIQAAETIKKFFRKGMLVILESTTYPGTTEEEILPILSREGLTVGRDFFLCFSPERIDPGNLRYGIRDIPKVVGGVTEKCTDLGVELYGTIVDKVFPVSSPRSAEMAKLIENTFRIVNIGLINELAIISRRLKLNIWEAIEAAKTKPFGFLPFYPGPGIGGHCIGIDPIYLSWKAKVNDVEVRLIDLASQINTAMPEYVLKRAGEELNLTGKATRGARVLILGVSYKRDIDDLRESPALEIMKGLERSGASVQFHDPHVAFMEWNGQRMASQQLTAKELASYDLVIVVTDHSKVDYAFLAKHARRILDTRNALRYEKNRENISML